MKRFLALLLTAAMLVSMLAITPVSAAEATGWDGTADTDWYNDTATEFTLTTAAQLAGLAELVDGGNTFAGKTIKLGADIDLAAKDPQGESISFNPIGYGYNIVFKLYSKARLTAKIIPYPTFIKMDGH